MHKPSNDRSWVFVDGCVMFCRESIVLWATGGCFACTMWPRKYIEWFMEKHFLTLIVMPAFFRRERTVPIFFEVFSYVFGEHAAIVEVDHHGLESDRRYYDVDRALEGGWRVSKSKRYSCQLVESMVGVKGCFMPVRFLDHHLQFLELYSRVKKTLAVAREAIHSSIRGIW